MAKVQANSRTRVVEARMESEAEQNLSCSMRQVTVSPTFVAILSFRPNRNSNSARHNYALEIRAFGRLP